MDTPDWLPGWLALAPHLPTAGLAALADALRADDPRVTTGNTTVPPDLPACSDFPVECACPIAWCYWMDGTGRATVREVAGAFGDAVLGIDPEASRALLRWVDWTDRDTVLRGLLPAVEDELARRRRVDAA